MKKLVIGEVNLLDPQSKAVLVALSHRMVKSHSLMYKLAENLIDIPFENEVFFNNVKVMMDNNNDFKDKYDDAIMRTTLLNVEDDFSFEYDEY